MLTDNTLALVFEVSKGCQLSCNGCRVNKASSGIPDDAVLCDLLTLCHDVVVTGRKLAEIEFGPTDIMSAYNRAEIFNRPLIWEITSLFSTIVLNTAMVHPDPLEYQILAHEVNRMAPNKPVGLVVPIEIKHVFNEKYINTIRTNVKSFQDALKYGFTEVIFSVIFDRTSMENVGNTYTYETLFSKVRELSVADNTAVDFAFHQGRDGLTSDFLKTDLRTSIRELNRQYILDLQKRDIVERRHVPSIALFDQEIREIVFHQNQLFIRPIVNERITVFHDSMKYQGEWNAESLFRHFDQRVQDNMNLAIGGVIIDCERCPYVQRCAERSIQQLMLLTDTAKCITLLPEYNDAFNEIAKR